MGRGMIWIVAGIAAMLLGAVSLAAVLVAVDRQWTMLALALVFAGVALMPFGSGLIRHGLLP